MLRKRLRSSEQRHRSIVNNLNNAESKTAELSQQQLKTKRKLCILYSRLQSFISRDDNDDLTSTMEIKGAITNTEIHKETYLLSWWRISILKSFDVGTWQELQRHAALRKGSDHSIEVEDLNKSASLTIPLCQYFLFGKCLDDKCVFLHPGEGLASIKSRSKYVDWVSTKQCQIQPNTKVNRESSVPSGQVSAVSSNDQHCNDPEVRISDIDTTESCKKRRYFSTQYSNSSTSWRTLFIENCSTNVNRNTLFEETIEENSSSETIRFRKFCTNILSASKFQDSDQRSSSICSYLEKLRVLLDSPEIGENHLTCAGDVQAWSLYLILLVESKILEVHPQIQFWSELVVKLKDVFSQSLTLIALTVIISNKLNNGMLEGIEESSSSSTLFDILHALGQLEEICNDGRCEVVIDMLCRYLQVPEFFQSELKDLGELEWEINCIPRNLAYAILLLLLVTGKFLGIRLKYLGDQQFFMGDECNINARKSIRTLFERCPLFRTKFVDVLFLAVNEMSESPITLANGSDVTSSTDNPAEMLSNEKVLSASEQSIWWCYIVILSSCDELNSSNYERCVRVCDHLSYPGVYEALRPLDLQPILGTIHISNNLLFTLDAYLNSTTLSIEGLETAYISINNDDSTNEQLILLPPEQFPVVDGPVEMFWNMNLKVYNSAESSIELVRHVSWWIIVGKANNLFQVSEIHRFSSMFTALLKKDKGIFPTVVLFRQVFAVIKEICCISKDHTTCVNLLTFLISVIEASIDQGSSILNYAYSQDKSSRGNEDNTDDNTDDSSLEVAGYWSGFDCTAPMVQHKLIISVMRHMQACRMLSYSTIEFILKSSLVTLHGPEVVVRWILDWFSDLTSSNVDQSDQLHSIPSIRVSCLVANAFSNSLYLSSSQSLARLSPHSLYDLGLHFLRSEYFESYSNIQQVLDDMPQVPRAALFATLLRMNSLPQESVRRYFSSKPFKSDHNGVDQSIIVNGKSRYLFDMTTKVFPLEEESLIRDDLNDSVIQRFHDAIVTCRSDLSLNGNIPDATCDVLSIDPLSVVDFSGLMGQNRKIGTFPFQSLALFADTIIELSLSNNFLKTIPLAICTLTKVTKLNLSNNDLDTFSDHITSSCCQIKVLDLSQNKYTTFPSAIFHLHNLENLKISYNLIEYIPNQIEEMKKLQSLNISDNRLKVINSNLTKLHFFAT